MKTSEILYKAADLLEEKGRTHGQCWIRELNTGDGYGYFIYTGNGPVCMIGAVGAVQGLDYGRCYDASDANTAIATYLHEQDYVSAEWLATTDTVHMFNDLPTTTDEEVLTVLRNAAGKAEADGR